MPCKSVSMTAMDIHIHPLAPRGFSVIPLHPRNVCFFLFGDGGGGAPTERLFRNYNKTIGIIDEL